MKTIPAQLLRHLPGLAALPTSDAAPDAVLLDRFVSRRDETAFTVLVARHGPMVLRLCRRVLGHVHDAEDAFQATFLVLARKAAAIRRRHHLAAWLHGTAHRLALKARTAKARQRRGEVAAPAPEPVDPQPDPLTRITARELLTALDEELGRLPEVYRLPLVLCCLEGRTQEEAARQLGWTPGAVKGRLERGRARLHARLARRGLTLSAALLALDALHGPAAAGVPGALFASTVRGSLLFAARLRPAGEISAAVLALADGVLQSMLLSKTKTVIALLLSAVVLGTGAGLFVFHSRAADGTKGPAAKAPAPPARKADKAERKKPMVDRKDLQGTWVAVSCEVNGKSRPEEVKGFRLTIEGHRFQWSRDGSIRHLPYGTFALDPSKQPKVIDFTQSKGPQQEKPDLIPGIYEFDGATLKICRAVSGGKRPTDFTTKPGSGRELLVFRRPAAGRPKKDAPVPDAWSEPVKGLSGRLRVVWVNQGDALRPEVTAELQNVEPAKVLAVSNRFDLEVRVTAEAGKEVYGEAPLPMDATAVVPERWGLIPAGAYLGYPTDLRCIGLWVQPQWFARGKPVKLALAGAHWTFAPGRYVVSARLTAGKTKSPPPPAATPWEGTLTLPPVEVVVPGE